MKNHNPLQLQIEDSQNLHAATIFITTISEIKWLWILTATIKKSLNLMVYSFPIEQSC
jgi:hypothetical protein|tara:strand:+ start:1248 stop:1421 length:174 start_codon:yes stop_codon:yes gene_type:complete